jgi:lipopolysaccharide assembly outer membrane protein LptD (OstA)
VSYMTQIDRSVPPFELPMTTARTSGLFIPVLCTPSSVYLTNG